MPLLSKNITKRDLAKYFETELKFSRRHSLRLVTGLFNFIRKSLEEGHKIQLNHFGTFEAHHRAGYKRKNPKTGETSHVNARRIVTFKPGMALRNLRPKGK